MKCKRMLSFLAAATMAVSSFAALAVTASAAESYTVSFNGEDAQSTAGYFTFSGKHNFNTKFSGANYAEITFKSGLKMESTTTISFTSTAESTVTIVQSTSSSNTIKFDDEPLAIIDAAEETGCRIYTVDDVAAGEHKITRGNDQSGLLYVEVAYKDDGNEPEPGDETKYAITVSTDGNGSAEADYTEAAEGTTVTITATPNDGYELDTITVNDTPIEGTSFDMPAGEAAVHVTFKAAESDEPSEPEIPTEPITWDFSDYNGASPLTEGTEDYNGLTLVGGKSVTITSTSGFYTGGNSSSSTRYIAYTPAVDGTLAVTFSSTGTSERFAAIATSVVTGNDVDTLKANEAVKAAGSSADKNANEVITANVSKGETYYIYSASGGLYIKKLVFSPGETYVPDETDVPAAPVSVTAVKDEAQDFEGTDGTKASLWNATIPANSITSVSVLAVDGDGHEGTGSHTFTDGAYTGDLSVYIIVPKSKADIQSVTLTIE